MKNLLRSLFGACALVVISSEISIAQQNPLLGAWSTTTTDAHGRNMVAYLEFRGDGSIRLKGFYKDAPKPFVETGTYRIDGEGSAVHIVFRTYSPKQCQRDPLHGRLRCEPAPFNINQPISKGFRFANSNTLIFDDNAEYHRAQRVP
jgi:hypothetical protein